jgi:tripartite-type tricarboxylate transporter receptor subunit TctC
LPLRTLCFRYVLLNPQSQNTPIPARLASKGVRASLGELGLEATIGTPQDLANALDEQARDWKIVIDTIGFKAE